MNVRHAHRVWLGLAAAAVVAAAGGSACHSSTGIVAEQIRLQRDLWNSQHLTDYTFKYSESGFGLGNTIRSATVVVSNRVVVSALDDEGDAVFPAGASHPTIDSIFDRVQQAQRQATLGGASFNGTLGYPEEVSILGSSGGVMRASQVTSNQPQ